MYNAAAFEPLALQKVHAPHSNLEACLVMVQQCHTRLGQAESSICVILLVKHHHVFRG